MSDVLDPSRSPSELNAPNVRRLSKLPAMIITGVAAVVVCLLGYSILTRGQPKEVHHQANDETSEFETTISSANDIIRNMDKPLPERPVLNSALQLKSPVVAEKPKPEVPKIRKEEAAANATPPVPRKSAEALASDEFALKVARAKEQLFLEALSSKTASASAPNNQMEKVEKNASPSAFSGSTPSGRDRASEQQEIRERLAQQQQPSSDFERIEKLLSTIVKNTNPQVSRSLTVARPQTSQSQQTGRLLQTQKNRLTLANNAPAGTFVEATREYGYSAESQRGQLNLIAPRGLTVARQTSQFQQTGRLSQAQKDLLALANNAPAGTFVEATREYGYSTESQRDQLTKTDLRVGTVIPAILINGINSELEGVAIGQVSQNVWDSTHGKHVLIPQGTRLIGEFKSDIKEGQSRVGVSWNRLHFPNGKTLSLSNMVGSDQAGFTGFADRVNNHYKKKFGSAALLSIISGVASVFASDSGEPSTGETISDQISQQYASVGSRLIEKNLTIPPTVIIRPGYRFTVIVTKDFVLEPYY